MPEATLEEVLAVARAHSTIVAARWAGWSRSRVVHARQTHDGYKRGRGHPSREELAREAPRGRSTGAGPSGVSGALAWATASYSVSAPRRWTCSSVRFGRPSVLAWPTAMVLP